MAFYRILNNVARFSLIVVLLVLSSNVRPAEAMDWPSWEILGQHRSILGNLFDATIRAQRSPSDEAFQAVRTGTADFQRWLDLDSTQHALTFDNGDTRERFLSISDRIFEALSDAELRPGSATRAKEARAVIAELGYLHAAERSKVYQLKAILESGHVDNQAYSSITALHRRHAALAENMLRKLRIAQAQFRRLPVVQAGGVIPDEAIDNVITSDRLGGEYLVTTRQGDAGPSGTTSGGGAD